MLASEISPGQVAGITIGIIVTAVVLSILVVVLIISIVLLYGYRHPDSGIGRYMIEVSAYDDILDDYFVEFLEYVCVVLR